jgi:glutamate dehydrogenase/leucine dehydrogenase
MDALLIIEIPVIRVTHRNIRVSKSNPICLRDHCPAAEADVYAPCALEGTPSERAIGHLFVSIVAGAAK